MSTQPLTRDEMAAKLRQTDPRFVALLPQMVERYLDRCMADQERNIREPWRTLTFDGTTEARGRNGWFTLASGDLVLSMTSQSRGYLSLFAKRVGNTAPIMLVFHQPEDMRMLARALTQAAETWDTLVTQEETTDALSARS